MEVKKGIPVSPGVSIGEAVVIGHEDLRIHRRYVSKSRTESEIRKLDRAVDLAVEEIDEEIARFGELAIPRQVLETHRDMIRDPSLRQEIVDPLLHPGPPRAGMRPRAGPSGTPTG